MNEINTISAQIVGILEAIAFTAEGRREAMRRVYAIDENLLDQRFRLAQLREERRILEEGIVKS